MQRMRQNKILTMSVIALVAMALFFTGAILFVRAANDQTDEGYPKLDIGGGKTVTAATKYSQATSGSGVWTLAATSAASTDNTKATWTFAGSSDTVTFSGGSLSVTGDITGGGALNISGTSTLSSLTNSGATHIGQGGGSVTTIGPSSDISYDSGAQTLTVSYSVYVKGLGRLIHADGIITTDATPATSTLISTPADNTTTTVKATVTARRTGGSSGSAGDGASYTLHAAFKTTSGTCTQIGSTIKAAIESQGAWDGELSVSGNDIICTMTGAANNNVTWAIEAQASEAF